ncbi:hypothetical protein PV326_001783 [Microctonus aethiopoides]|nr:hypothetical protein PV326_001783 [Microctonus aethiopoides]
MIMKKQSEQKENESESGKHECSLRPGATGPSSSKTGPSCSVAPFIIGRLYLRWPTMWPYKMSYGVSKTRLGPNFRTI